MALNIDPECQNAWTRLTTSQNDVSWILCGYPEGKTNELIFKSEGTGGMPELINNLGDEAVWGGFKVVGVDDRGNTVSRRPKFIFIKYIPPSLPTLKKAKVGGHKGAIKGVLSGAHIDYEFDTIDELTEEAIIQKLRASGGAHAPTSYEFSNYTSSSSLSI